jgi:site-specific recombinase XerD
MLEELFQQFIREKKLLSNITKRTVDHFECSWRSFQLYAPAATSPAELTKKLLREYVEGMRVKGLSAKSCNTYASGINSFLKWLHEEGHKDDEQRIKLLKAEKKVFKTHDDDQLAQILAFVPHNFYEWRVVVMLSILTDTGIRVDEVIRLDVADIDMSNMLMKVHGKGQKQRMVPFSLELRKLLHRFMKMHKHQPLLPTKIDGRRVSYWNMRRDFHAVCDKMGVPRVDGCFHAFRRKFASNYVRNGGNVFYLQQVMGHENVETTRGYVTVEVEALQETHQRTSLLSRIRK